MAMEDELDIWPCLTWDVADGFAGLHGWSQALPAARDPLSVLEQVEKLDGDGVFVLKDFHECWGNAQVKRKLRSVAQRYREISRTASSPRCPDPADFAAIEPDTG